MNRQLAQVSFSNTTRVCPRPAVSWVALLLLLVASMVARPGHAAGIAVDTEAPSHPTLCTLFDAVVAAESGASFRGCVWDDEAVVELEKGKTYLLPDRLPNILGNVAIHGSFSLAEPAIIKFDAAAPAERRFVKVTGSGRLDLRNVILEGGNRIVGGAIRIGPGATLDVANVTFRNNSADNQGGAIYNLGATLLERVTFEGNTATFGGAVFNSGSGTVEANGSLFTANSGIMGGAIYQDGGPVDVENSTFSANRAFVGGALVSKSGQSKIDLSTFRNNSATNTGGTIFAEWGSVVIGRSALTAEAGPLCFGSQYLSSTGNNATSDATCGLVDPSDQNVGAPIPMSELVHHGGLTRVHVPLCDWTTGACVSPLIDQYSCCAFGACPTGEEPIWDQRAQFARRSAPGMGWAFGGGDSCDIGAYESICEGSIATGSLTSVLLHEYQVVSDAPPVLLDNGACFSHDLGFDPGTDCRIRWSVYGAQLKIKSIVFLDPSCALETCFPDAAACATSCPGSPPSGWLEDQNTSAGTVAFDVPACNGPTEQRRYVLEIYSVLDPSTTWWWDPRTPVEIDI